MQYDTDDIERVACQVRRCAGLIPQTVVSELSAARNQLDGNFKGQAADVLDARITDLKRDMNSLESGLNTIAAALDAFVVRVKAKDQQLRGFIER